MEAAVAIDGHNWLFPVAYGVIETESKESWTWFIQHLKIAISTPIGLVISTDAGKGIEGVVDDVYPGVEHRECMRHLWKNFKNSTMGSCSIIICGQQPRVTPLKSSTGTWLGYKKNVLMPLHT